MLSLSEGRVGGQHPTLSTQVTIVIFWWTGRAILSPTKGNVLYLTELAITSCQHVKRIRSWNSWRILQHVLKAVRDHKKVRWRKPVGFLPGMRPAQNDKAQLTSMLLYLPTAAMALSLNLPTALTVMRGAASSSSAALQDTQICYKKIQLAKWVDRFLILLFLGYIRARASWDAVILNKW